LYDVRICYVSPKSLSIPEDVKRSIPSHIPQTEYEQLTDEVLSKTDVLYVTRIQKERFASQEEYEAVKNSFTISISTLTHAKPSTIVMHPLPRVNEIDPEVDLDQRAAYFRQMKYGLYVRMALLALVMAN
jgi:carbamoyl-phosphate synthase / aspartate carbamoyltransferase